MKRSEQHLRDRKLHFIGIGGAGMSGLALVADLLGAEVTGSDREQSSYTGRLQDAGIDPQIGHHAAAVPPSADVVVSTAIGDDNTELIVARQRGQHIMHRGELLAELCAHKRLVAVAGTHGKTTTAAMLVHAVQALDAEPAFFLGGELPGAGPGGETANARWGDGEWVIAEADESDASFLELEPEVAVVTNIELDHHSRWSSRRELVEAFERFMEPAEYVVAGPGVADDTNVSTEARPTTTSFELDFELAVPGRHNAYNALAAVAALEAMGLDVEAGKAALSDFPGVARRMELKGSVAGAQVYDDYAHHPTEVEATLAAARELGEESGGRLIAAFQPHLYSRTKALANEFGAALGGADEVAVLDVYPAREEPVGKLAGVSGLMVAEAAADHAAGKPVWWLPDAESAARALRPRIGSGDLVVTIGAGDIYKVAEALVDDG